MISRDYESAVTTGKAHWFTYFAHDPAGQKLVVGLTRDPETSETDRVLEFCKVKSIHEDWIDHDEQSIEGLLGASEEKCGPDFRYLLVTDQREIEIVAGTQGSIYDA